MLQRHIILPSLNLFLQDLIMDWVKKCYFSIIVQIAFYHPGEQFSLFIECCFHVVISQGKVRKSYLKRELVLHEEIQSTPFQ